MATESTTSPKILSMEQFRAYREVLSGRGQTLVQCHGCFDIVHPGHVRHLEQARRLGDALLVSVTSDAGVGKGPGRPLFNDRLRAENLAALGCVDCVIVDHHPTAAALLEVTQPDVYVKGREYETNNDPRFAKEREIVVAHGGKVVFSSGDVVFSSTALIGSMDQTEDPAHSQITKLLERHAITRGSIDGLLGAFKGRKVAVIGECIADTYQFCDRPGVAGESPIMTLRPLEARSYDGGASIIAQHLAALGADPVLVTGHPPSRDAAALRDRLHSQRIETRWTPTEHRIVEKQRFLVGSQKVMKVDFASPIELDASQQDALVGIASETCDECDAVIIADFGQGLLTGEMVKRLCETLRSKVDVMAGDVSGHRSNLTHFRDVDVLCPSEPELRDAAHDHASGLSAVAWDLMRTTRAKGSIITMGAEGLIAFDRIAGCDEGAKPCQPRLIGEHVPALCANPIDALGCGDAMLATVTLGLASGLTLPHSAVLGAVAAALQAGKLGNAVIGADELRSGFAPLCDARLAAGLTPRSETPLSRAG